MQLGLSNRNIIRLEYSSSNTKKSFVSDFKIDDYFFKLGYDVSNCVITFGSSASQLRIRLFNWHKHQQSTKAHWFC